MAHEFVTSLGRPLSLIWLGEKLVHHGLSLVDRKEDEYLKLRWTESELRVDWPEDVTVSIESDQLFVIIHQATASQRERILNTLEVLLAQAEGHPVRFEEL